MLGDVGGLLQIISTVISLILSSYGEKAFIFDFMHQMKVVDVKPKFLEKLCMSRSLREAYDKF